MALTVEEAANTWVSAMRNALPAGPGVCSICHTFIDPTYDKCYPCNSVGNSLDAVVPITYSEALSQMHTVLRNYKDGPDSVQKYMRLRLAAILWKFLDLHEQCVAMAAGATGDFDVVTIVPPKGAARRNLDWIVGEVCVPTVERYERLLTATGKATGREYSPNRYRVNRRLGGENVLLIDDTWTRGGHAQSAAWALRQAGAETIAAVVIGRHVNPEWDLGDQTHGEIMDALPKRFDWDTCAVHSVQPAG